MKYYVYQYLDPTTRTPFYVGKGTGKRFSIHLNKARMPIRKKSYPVIDKCRSLLENNQEPIIEVLQYFDTEDAAYLAEAELIRSIGRRDLNTGPLLNLTDGGIGSVSRKWSDERKQRWSGENNPMSGKVPWKEAGLSNPMLGSKHTDESKKKMSDKVKASYTPDLVKLRSDRIKGKNNPAYGKPAVNRRAVMFRNVKFDSITHACNYFNVRKGIVYKEGIFD